MIVYILKYLLAVLMLDDDILISFPDVSFAFSVWKVIKSATVWLSAFWLEIITNFENVALLYILVASKQFPDQIVGFVSRKHISTAAGDYIYGSLDPKITGGDR